MRIAATMSVVFFGTVTGGADIADQPAITVFRDPARYNSFPDVVTLPDGRILCVFRDCRYPDRVTHIDPDARVVGCVSSDDGRTWSKPQVIYDDRDCQQDPSVAVLRDGRIVLNCFTWVGVPASRPAAERSPFARRVNYGEWGEYARVGGVSLLWGKADPLTWNKEPVHVSGTLTDMRATSARMIELEGGTLLVPTYGASGQKRQDGAFVLRSTDAGKTWKEFSIAASFDKVQLHEPALIETGKDQVLAVMRSAGAGDHLFAARSSDAGRTWSPLERLAIIGHPADLLRLPDGRILMVYGYRHEPFGVRACTSTDDGRTWELARETVITRAGAQGDLGYPSACLTRDGHILIAYYMNGPNTKDRWIECKRVSLDRLAVSRAAPSDY
jgi:hypothetical protein